MMDVVRSIIRRIVATWNRLFHPQKEEQIPAVEISREPGLRCPECNTMIPVSITELLHVGSVVCHGCTLVLEVDRDRSHGALDALQRLQSAHDDARRISRSG